MARSSRPDRQPTLTFDAPPQPAGDVSDQLARAASTPRLLPHVPELDVQLDDARWARATITDDEPARTQLWLREVAGRSEPTAKRRARLPADRLSRLLAYVHADSARVHLDAAATAVARALEAHTEGLRPLKVTRRGQRLLASSPRGWPPHLAVRDAPWSAIAALLAADVPVDTDEQATTLAARRLIDAGLVGRAVRAGASARIDTPAPTLLERLDLPALLRVDGRGSGRYQMPLPAATALLDAPVELSEDLERTLRRLSRRPRPKATPPEFPWQLYAFQARDVAAAAQILETSGGVLLAGTMGTGKTIVAATLLEQLRLWPAVIVAPLAALTTWQRHLAELGRDVLVATGSADDTRAALRGRLPDAVVITYDRLHAVADDVERAGFTAILADEIQRIRSASSRRSRALRRLAAAAPYRVGLSGTPLQNRLTDLLPIGAFLAPGEWRARATRKDLADRYAAADPVAGVAEHLGALMVRRRMEDTGVRLPEAREFQLPVELTGEQRQAIRDVEEDARSRRDAGAYRGTDAKLHVFAKLQRIRQIISSPQAVGLDGTNPKLDAALDLAEEYASAGKKVVLFTALRATFEETTRRLQQRGLGWVGIEGSTSASARADAERRFHNDDRVHAFVGSIFACGESLTLSPTARATVWVDLVYCLGTMRQSAARARRLNQTDPVEAVLLVARGSADERIVTSLRAKQELFDQVVDGASAPQATIGEQQASLDELLHVVTGDGAAPTGGAPQAGTV